MSVSKDPAPAIGTKRTCQSLSAMSTFGGSIELTDFRVVEVAKESWCEAEVHRLAGEIALLSPERDAALSSTAVIVSPESGSVFRARAWGCSRPAGEVLGAACCDG